jgi:hypothetical protein
MLPTLLGRGQVYNLDVAMRDRGSFAGADYNEGNYHCNLCVFLPHEARDRVENGRSGTPVQLGEGTIVTLADRSSTLFLESLNQ